MANKKKSNKGEIPWVEKYRPKSLSEMMGFEDIAKQLENFIKNFRKYKKMMKKLKSQLKKEKDKRKKKRFNLKYKSIKTKFNSHKSCMLIGPPGVGKTTIAYSLANDYGLSVIEMNASDTRTKNALKEQLQETVKSTNLLSFTTHKRKGKLVLIDEVDGLHGNTDRGGVKAIKEIIATSRYPIIMTCNFKDNRKFKSLYKIANPVIDLPVAKKSDVARIVHLIAKKENIEISKKQIKIIASRSNGDYRSAINDLQALSQGTKKIREEDLDNINMNRDSEEEIYDALFNIFTASTIKEAKRELDTISSRDADFRTIHRWINENIFKLLNKGWDLYYAFQHLAYVDHILGYILRTQDYKHLSYFYDILAGGIRFSKTDKRIAKSRLRYPRWFRTSAPSDDESSKILQQLYRVSLNKIMKKIKPNLLLFLKYDKDLYDYLGKVLKITGGDKKKEQKKVRRILK